MTRSITSQAREVLSGMHPGWDPGSEFSINWRQSAYLVEKLEEAGLLKEDQSD